ncbi:competence ComEA-like helix-hairpin-helix protein [Pontibacter ummariensis]|uniref:Competence protein ComEA helix-hairpin-helix repeat region n=1 Tax=Pontibacter ummariensis TaxID=1610492 RepID=A0A239B5Q9_9BACT|nr:helix-hairpin-helix domain-containing protein [Pontibacter ummariensis]PRY16312.1 competence ComEA-like helix-hairpin-helix protein [Pontibacter ummariensis]SNS02972.1 competence protein ComEA helix-hairpin-helix repeat region [Pontibacter ummariensis]
MRKIKHWIRRYFGFSQREVNGFLLLISLMVLLTAAPFLFDAFYSPSLTDSTARDRQLLDSLVAQLEAKQPERARAGRVAATIALKPFDPNQLSLEEWQAYGLPKYLAQRILNYRHKVGDFTYKAELGKIYGLPDSLFQQLLPYIQLPEERPDKHKQRQAIAGAARPTPDTGWDRNPRKEKPVLVPFNINTADTVELKQIRGIGSKLSARIVKYRSSLGGFYSTAQLQEVYGLQPEVVDSLQKYSYVAKTYTPQGLHINTATADELKTHPYVTPNIARAIVAYREQHGPYKQLDDIQQIRLVTPELFEKLRPYLAL